MRGKEEVEAFLSILQTRPSFDMGAVTQFSSFFHATDPPSPREGRCALDHSRYKSNYFNQTAQQVSRNHTTTIKVEAAANCRRQLMALDETRHEICHFRVLKRHRERWAFFSLKCLPPQCSDVAMPTLPRKGCFNVMIAWLFMRT